MPDLLKKLYFEEETYAIIGACMEVHKKLGSGFLEAIYQEALSIEFEEREIPYEREKQLTVYYKGIELSKKYIADFICYNNIILEIKAVNSIAKEHISQLLNYLHATNHKIGLVVNFGAKSLEFKRVII